jgi:hypothetical protein
MVAAVVVEVVTEMTGIVAIEAVVTVVVVGIETIVVSNVERADISVANVPMEGIVEDIEVAVIEVEAEI